MTAGRTPAQVYETFFVPGMFAACTEALLDVVPPRPGERVLDVACGSGVVARAAAERVGPEGAVTGVDLRPGMIEVAESLPPPRGARVEWRVGDAHALEDADASYDLVLCQQGLQFFPDREAAAAEMRRVLVPGGRVGVAVWQGLDRNDFFRELTDVEASHLQELGQTYEDLAGPFLFGDAEGLRDLLSGAGFSDVRVEEREIEGRFPAERFVENVEFAYSAVVPEFSEDPRRFAAFVAVDGDEIVFPIRVNVATGWA